MGGEPTLRMDLVEYIVEKAEKLNHKFALTITTNGLLLNPYLEKFKKWTNNYNHFTLEISYDASGQFRRKFPNGKSSRKVVEYSMVRCIEANIPFKISYTLHTGNIDNFVKDIIYIMEKYGKHITSLKVGVAFKEISNHFGDIDIVKKYKPYMKQIYKMYGIPICDFVCGDCGICDKSSFVGNNYLSPKSGIIKSEKKTQKEFEF
jgi:MoaA/NifB/PqqE/SkfB family radical SAM enzyme